MKITKTQLKQIIKEEISKVLNEDEGKGAVKYDIDDYRITAKISLPTGEPLSFAQVIEDLQGQELTSAESADEDGNPIIETWPFTLDNWKTDPDDSLHEIAYNIIKGGQADFHIEQWAKLKGYDGAERARL